MKNFILFIFFIAVSSCTQNALSPAIDCMGEVDDTTPAECVDEIEGSKFCAVNYVGKFTLSEQAKAYLPVYCEDIGSTITFTNGVGDDQTFTVSNKAYTSSSTLVIQERLCESDSTRTSIDCIENEKAWVILKSDQHTFELSVITLPDTKAPDSGNVGDFFQIKREEVPGFFVEEWSSVINQRSLSYEFESCTEFYPGIELNGTTFEDVTGFEEEEDCAHFMYFINQEYGLVGFSRSDGVLWSLVK